MLKIVNATYSDTSLSIAVFLSAFIICIVSFRQGLFFIKLIRGTKSLFGAIYLLLSDIFMSLFIFCIGLSFFAGLISYKFDTFRTGTLVIYYEEKCDGTKCRFETSRYTIWGKEFETVLGQHDLKNLDDFSNNIELIGAVVDSNAYLKNQDGTSVTGVIFQDDEIGAVIIRLNYSNYDTFWTRLGILFDRIVSDIPRYLKSGFTYYAFLDFEVNISDMNPDYREAISIAYNHPDSFPTLSYYLRTTEGTLNGYIIRRAFSFLFTDQAIEIIKNYAPGLTTSEIAKFENIRTFKSLELRFLSELETENGSSGFYTLETYKNGFDTDAIVARMSKFDESIKPITTYLIASISISFLAVCFFLLITAMRIMEFIYRQQRLTNFISHHPFFVAAILFISVLLISELTIIVT